MIKLLGLQVFDGPSVYSHKPVARLSVKMEEYIDTPSTEIKGFYAHLTSHFPGLESHFCSKGYPGGFLERLREGTYLAHIIEHLCLEMQSTLGYDVKYGKTRRAEGDCYDIVFGYKKRQIIEPCVHFVMDFIVSFLNKKKFDFNKCFSQIKEINKQDVLELYRPVPGLLITIAGKGDHSGLCQEISKYLKQAGYLTATACAQGLFVDGICIDHGNAADYAGAKKTLADPSVNAVVLETSRQSILQDGLAYDKADICIFTGMEADPLKYSRIGTVQDEEWMEEMLHQQSLPAEAVKQGGTSILNAEDPLIVPLMERARGRIILYGRNKNTPVIKNHMTRGGDAAIAGKDDSIHAAVAAAACFALGICPGKKQDHLLQKFGAISTSSV